MPDDLLEEGSSLPLYSPFRLEEHRDALIVRWRGSPVPVYPMFHDLMKEVYGLLDISIDVAVKEIWRLHSRNARGPSLPRPHKHHHLM